MTFVIGFEYDIFLKWLLDVPGAKEEDRRSPKPLIILPRKQRPRKHIPPEKIILNDLIHKRNQP